MFDFFDMLGTHNERLVDRYEGEGLLVDTCQVNDLLKPYETAIAHLAYNLGKWVIVEDYDDTEDAQAGHDKWVEIMTADNLPKTLTDIHNSMIAEFLVAIGGSDLTYEKGE